MSGLICDECGLPVVPFGGEDICMGHPEEYERDTWPGDEDDDAGDTSPSRAARLGDGQ